ncbi:Coiled-coil domain-containing protein [Sarcoptes scabiei]|nr:Coiled-coil domain-containing protein [Sarcoptes scabiei]
MFWFTAIILLIDFVIRFDFISAICLSSSPSSSESINRNVGIDLIPSTSSLCLNSTSSDNHWIRYEFSDRIKNQTEMIDMSRDLSDTNYYINNSGSNTNRIISETRHLPFIDSDRDKSSSSSIATSIYLYDGKKPSKSRPKHIDFDEDQIKRIAPGSIPPFASSKSDLLFPSSNFGPNRFRPYYRKIHRFHRNDRNKHHHHHHSHHSHHHSRDYRRYRVKKPVFIPVALYSVTKKVPKRTSHNRRHRPFSTSVAMSPSNLSINRKQFVSTDTADDSDEVQDKNQYESHTAVDQNRMDHHGGYGEEDGGGQDGDYEMKKESAVYGYVRKPEIIEFKGHYYYGDGGDNLNYNSNNDGFDDGQTDEIDFGERQMLRPSDYDGDLGHYGGVGGVDGEGDHDEDDRYHNHPPHHQDRHPQHHHDVSYVPTIYETSPPYHHHHYDHHDHHHHHTEPSLSTLLLAKLKKALLVKGITAKGLLLLATIPLILTPMLSYWLTPVVIPITATVAAGRKRRRKREALAQQTKNHILSNILDRKVFDDTQTQEIDQRIRRILPYLDQAFEVVERWHQDNNDNRNPFHREKRI